LKLFELAGLQLVKYETWPLGREGDSDFQNYVIAQLEQSYPPAAAERVRAVKDEIGALRFRPEEVAGAAIVATLPAAFVDASANAQEILARLADAKP
jgi:hypothetical protein